jgi:hypothetical protein
MRIEITDCPENLDKSVVLLSEIDDAFCIYKRSLNIIVDEVNQLSKILGILTDKKSDLTLIFREDMIFEKLSSFFNNITVIKTKETITENNPEIILDKCYYNPKILNFLKG